MSEVLLYRDSVAVKAEGLEAGHVEESVNPNSHHQAGRARTLHPTPYTLHPTPYTLHPTPCTPRPIP